jgi:GNAT superfamily N-acetyltransferase
MRITTKEITTDCWPSIETLFGSNGACGGCWCQAWRISEDERWEDVKGPTARSRMRKGVRGGTIRRILAFVGERPVGWCTFGPRDSFPRLNRAPTLKCDDSSRVWSVPCFYVLRDYREKGVAGKLLGRALKVMKQSGVAIVEGYPAKPDRKGRSIAAFSWTGTRSLFEKEGFVVVGNRNGSKQRVRKWFHTTPEDIIYNKESFHHHDAGIMRRSNK